MLPLATVPDYNCVNESDVEQKFLYPLLVNPAFLSIPARSILSKRSLGSFSFVEKSSLPRNYIPDYIIFFDGLPACIIEAKEPNTTADQALQEARLYAQVLNAQFPTGINSVSMCVGCNGVEIAIGPEDTNDCLRFAVTDLIVGSASLRDLRINISWNV